MRYNMKSFISNGDVFIPSRTDNVDRVLETLRRGGEQLYFIISVTISQLGHAKSSLIGRDFIGQVQQEKRGEGENTRATVSQHPRDVHMSMVTLFWVS